MKHPNAKPKAAAPKRASATTSRKRTDAVRDIVPLPVRLQPDLRARLDAIAAARNAELAKQGASTSATALAVTAIREFCEREEARASTGAP